MTGRPRILVDPFPRRRRMIFSEAQWARLNALAEVSFVEGEAPMPAAEVETLLPDVAAILGQTDLSAERIARAENLRAVINVEGNFQQNVDYEACFDRGIEVLSIAPVFALPVAEMALGMALGLARDITGGDRAMREGREQYGRLGTAGAVLLSEQTIGLVGYGNLGRALRRLLEGFRARVLVHDPWLPDSAVREDGCEPASLEEVLSGCGVIFLLAGVTAENRGFLGPAELARIRDGAIVVLASRAAIVDFDALIAEANTGRLRVATDVFPEEPVQADHPVRRSRMLLSAHRAGGIASAFHDIGERVLDDLDLVLRGLPPVRLQAARRQTVSRMQSKAGRSYREAEEAVALPANEVMP